MLTEVPWYVWLIASGPVLAAVMGGVWGWASPLPTSQARYALSWDRWHRATVVVAVVQGPLLTILFALMLAASDRGMQAQRHHAMATVKEAMAKLEALQAEMMKTEERYARHQAILVTFDSWQVWDRLRQKRWEELP